MLEWLRFILFTVLLALGAMFMLNAVIGVNRFGFSLNRLHAASIGDTSDSLKSSATGSLFCFASRANAFA